MNHLNQLLLLCLAIVRDSTNYEEPKLIADTNWVFQSLKPIKYSPDYHRGEIAEFHIGIDKQEDGVYVNFGNSGDEVIVSSVKEFIEYINIFKP